MLGVILTAHTTLGGAKMIFRYPPVIRDKVSQATLREFAASKAKAADDDELRHPHHHVTHHPPSASSSSSTTDAINADASSTTNANPTNTNTNDDSSNNNTSNDMLTQLQSGAGSTGDGEATAMQFAAFGLPSVELASLLMPKSALCDLPFRVVVDNTKFIGHPTSIPPRDLRRQRVAAAASAPPLVPAVLANNVDEDMSDSGEFDELDDLDDVALAGGNGGDAATASDGGDADGDSASPRDAKNQVEITRVNIVFGVPITESQEDEYHRMAAQLGMALRHEEMRCCYLSRELHTLLSIRERWLADVASAKPGEQPPTHSELYQRIVTESQLASELRHMYHSIRDYGIASLRFNNWINVFVSLRQVNVDFSVQRPLRPYQTLLLLDSRIADVSDGGGKQRASLPLPPDVSPRLAALLEACRPTKSFRALQLETQIPLSQLFRLASHLVYWRKARVVHMLTKNNVYILKPDVARWKEQHRFLYRVAGEQVKLQADSASVRKRDSIAVLCVKFARQFPSFRLAELLERFSTPKPLIEHMSQFAPTLQRDFINVVVWLLKHNLLEQMFVYVFLMVPPPPTPPPGADAATLAATEVAMHVVEDAAESRSVLAYHAPTRQLMYASDTADAAAAAPGRVRLPSSSSGALDDDAAQSGLEWLEQQSAVAGDDVHTAELAAVHDANARCSLFASAPSPLYEYEQRHIASLDDGSPQYRLLKRVVRYFRGTHPLEEIMWRENIERIDLVQVLDKFKSILVQCSQQQQQEDS